MRDGVEATLEIGVHHAGESELQEGLHRPPGFSGAFPRPEAVAAGEEFRFEDRFYDHLDRHLDYPVLDGRYAKGTLLAAALVNLDPSYRVRPAAAVLEGWGQFG
jgi:hypothetical protein